MIKLSEYKASTEHKAIQKAALPRRVYVPLVEEAKYTACGNCVAVYPKKNFSLVAQTAKMYAACTSQDIGKVVMEVCGVGCITCRKCEKACEHDAMQVIDNLARIDYAKCMGCHTCVEVCPTKVIRERK